MPMAQSTERLCPNCGEPAPDRFCPRCGQSQEAARKSVWRWAREVAAEELALDAKLPRTFGLLLFRPGRLTSEWIAGRRARYLPPFRLLLLSLVAMLAVAFSVELGSFRSELNEGYLRGRRDAWREFGAALPYWGPDVSALEVEAEGPAMALAGEQVTREAVTWAVLVSLPVIALALLLLHLGRPYYLVDHIIFTLHTGAFLILVMAFVLGAVSLVERFWRELSDAPVILLGLIALTYLYLALREVYGGGRLASAAKTLVVVSLVAAVALMAILWPAVRTGEIGDEQSDRAYAFYRHAAELWADGDTAELRRFAPAAIAEFERIPYGFASTEERFHLARIQLWAGRPAAARQTLEEVLDEEPDHLLLLGLAARAAVQEGKGDLAARFREGFRTADSASDRSFWGYGPHRELLETLRSEIAAASSDTGG